jgi:hypothetical protein
MNHRFFFSLCMAVCFAVCFVVVGAGGAGHDPRTYSNPGDSEPPLCPLNLYYYCYYHQTANSKQYSAQFTNSKQQVQEQGRLGGLPPSRLPWWRSAAALALALAAARVTHGVTRMYQVESA